MNQCAWCGEDANVDQGEVVYYGCGDYYHQDCHWTVHESQRRASTR